MVVPGVRTPSQRQSVATTHGAELSPTVPSSSIRTPATSPVECGTSRAVTSATAMPEAASPLRLSRTRSVSPTKFRKRLLRRLCCEPSEEPCVGGIRKRVCGPPGPLNVPRLIMSHMPVKPRCCVAP